MQYECDVVAVSPVTLAATEAFLSQPEIPQHIPGMLQTLHAWLRDTETEPTGPSHAVYDRFGPDGMRLRIGVPIARAVESGAAVSCSVLAGGKAAHTRHRGAYDGLPGAHMALNEWCEAQGLEPVGEAWEVYGEWQTDPSRLVTDVYIRLAR